MKPQIINRLIAFSIGLVIITMGLIFGLMIANHQVREYKRECRNYKEAACILNDICRQAIDNQDLDQPGFEDMYYDTVDNLDCYKVHIDKEFIDSLY